MGIRSNFETGSREAVKKRHREAALETGLSSHCRIGGDRHKDCPGKFYIGPRTPGAVCRCECHWAGDKAEEMLKIRESR